MPERPSATVEADVEEPRLRRAPMSRMADTITRNMPCGENGTLLYRVTNQVVP